MWALHYRFLPEGPLRTVAKPVGVAVVVLCCLAPQPVLTTGIVLAALVALHLLDLHVAERHRPASVPTGGTA